MVVKHQHEPPWCLERWYVQILDHDFNTKQDYLGLGVFSYENQN